MILRRLTANLRAQNWTAIAIELVIVIVGVFLGIQAANWNQARLERREAELLLTQLRPELTGLADYFQGVKEYYAITKSYADRAFAGWEGDPSVSDREFVVSAYQASQIMGVGTQAEIWSLIFGANEIRNIEDAAIRNDLSRLMTFDFSLVNMDEVRTKYREDVRRIIPQHIQSAIRKQCGDRRHPGRRGLFQLPRSCDIDLPDSDARAAADKLRSRPDLPDELRWHLAAAATLLLNIETLDGLTRDLARKVERL